MGSIQAVNIRCSLALMWWALQDLIHALNVFHIRCISPLHTCRVWSNRCNTQMILHTVHCTCSLINRKQCNMFFFMLRCGCKVYFIGTMLIYVQCSVRLDANISLGCILSVGVWSSCKLCLILYWRCRVERERLRGDVRQASSNHWAIRRPSFIYCWIPF